MKALLPTKQKEPSAKDNPFQKSSAFSKFTFSWISELIRVSSVRTWDQPLNYDLSPEEHVQYYKIKLEKEFKKRKKLVPTVIHFFKKRLIFLTVMSIICALLNFGANLITAQFFSELSENKDITQFENFQPLIIWIVLLVLVKTLAEMLSQYFLFTAQKLSQVMKATVMAIIQDKICKFSTLNSSKFTEGYLTNLVQVDTVLLGDMISNMFNFINMVVSVIVSTGGMIYFVGFGITFIVEGIFILVNLINFILYYFKMKVRKNYLKAKDKRMTCFQNVLEKIDYVKTRGFENFYTNDIYEYRESELGYLRQNAAIEGVLTMLTWFSFGVTAITLMLIYSFNKGQSDITFATFTGMTGNLENMRGTFAEAFIIWSFFVGMKVNVNRIDDFLNAKEIDRSHVLRTKDISSRVAVLVENGNFKWRYSAEEEEEIKKSTTKQVNAARIQGNSEMRELNKPSVKNEDDESHRNTLKKSALEKDDDDFEKNINLRKDGSGRNTFFLKSINFKIKKGEKVAVIGASTSGKSSLLYSLLGEMIPMDIRGKAKVITNGIVSYLSQQRWIIGDTIRENITLGSKYSEDLMEKALEASQFLEDLKVIDKGLDTVLSDSGDTVSGGQRARIALARCFYQK